MLLSKPGRYKKPRRDDDGVKRPASLFQVRQRNSSGYTFCPDNGGNSGLGYWTVCTAFTLAALRTIQRRRLCRALTAPPLSVTPFQRLLFLFTAIAYEVGLVITKSNLFVNTFV
jgi:hypothetical protein